MDSFFAVCSGCADRLCQQVGVSVCTGLGFYISKLSGNIAQQFGHSVGITNACRIAKQVAKLVKPLLAHVQRKVRGGLNQLLTCSPFKLTHCSEQRAFQKHNSTTNREVRENRSYSIIKSSLTQPDENGPFVPVQDIFGICFRPTWSRIRFANAFRVRFSCKGRHSDRYHQKKPHKSAREITGCQKGFSVLSLSAVSCSHMRPTRPDRLNNPLRQLRFILVPKGRSALNQAELAAVVGIPLNTLKNLECGRAPFSSLYRNRIRCETGFKWHQTKERWHWAPDPDEFATYERYLRYRTTIEKRTEELRREDLAFIGLRIQSLMETVKPWDQFRILFRINTFLEQLRQEFCPDDLLQLFNDACSDLVEFPKSTDGTFKAHMLRMYPPQLLAHSKLETYRPLEFDRIGYDKEVKAWLDRAEGKGRRRRRSRN
jgi:hypothetical protein